MDNEKKPKTPAAGIGAMLRSMPGYTRITFIAAVIAGFATHLYMLTNKLPNHDDIGHMLGETYGTPSGRWLLPLMEKLDGDFSMPWLIGVLSIIALAFAAGAMLSVVASELIPDIAPANRTFATLGFLLGFAIMMVLDLAITI